MDVNPHNQRLTTRDIGTERRHRIERRYVEISDGGRDVTRHISEDLKSEEHQDQNERRVCSHWAARTFAGHAITYTNVLRRRETAFATLRRSPLVRGAPTVSHTWASTAGSLNMPIRQPGATRGCEPSALRRPPP